MIEKHSILCVDEYLEKNPNSTFELLQILDMYKIKEEPYYFIAILRNIKTNWNEKVLVSPELLRVKYRVGYYYKAGKRVAINEALQKDFIEINAPANYNLIQNKTIFNESKFFIDGLNAYFHKFFYKQWSYKIELENSVLVVPCSTIAIRFYFLSASMKNAVMEGTLDELYYHVFDVEDDEIKIHIKKRANKKDLPFLCRFLSNNESMGRLKYFYNQRAATQNESISLKSHFPVSGQFNIAISYKILDYRINDKPVYYVQNITNDDSPLGFSKIEYKQFSNKKDPKDVLSTSIRLPRRNQYKKKSFREYDNVIRQGTPSSNNRLEVIFESAEKDLNTLNLKVRGENIYTSDDGSPLLFDEKNDEVGSYSFEPSNSQGNNKLSQASYVEVQNKVSPKGFTLTDFMQLYDELMQRIRVQEIEEIDSFEVPVIRTEKRNHISSKCLNVFTNKARKFLFSIFAYDNRCVCLVEFEHDTWAPSSWFFVSKDIDTEWTIETMNDIISHFIKTENITYEQLGEYVMRTYTLKFIHHNHKNDEVDDIAIDRWCENLLDKILLVSPN